MSGLWEPPENEQELKRFIKSRVAFVFGAMAMGLAIGALTVPDKDAPPPKSENSTPAPGMAGPSK